MSSLELIQTAKTQSRSPVSWMLQHKLRNELGVILPQSHCHVPPETPEQIQFWEKVCQWPWGEETDHSAELVNAIRQAAIDAGYKVREPA